MRISKTDYYLGIAEAVSRRSTCLRRRYGAVIVKNDQIISTGYNGAPRGEENCCDVGYCYRMANNIPHGQQYERCRSVHAEQNAIISAARADMIGATLYLWGEDAENGQPINAEPCDLCRRMIKNAGIVRVVTISNKKEEERLKEIKQEMIDYARSAFCNSHYLSALIKEDNNAESFGK